MSDYTDAPACKMLDARCAVCSRELLDAVSVEVGMGPVCRERHGYAEVEDASEEARSAANTIVRRIASFYQDENERLAGCAALRLLGFHKLAERIEFRGKDAPAAKPVEVERRAGMLIVWTPYRPAAVEAFRAIRGRRWDGEAKANVVPEGARRQLWDLLRSFFAGLPLLVDGVACGPIKAVA